MSAPRAADWLDALVDALTESPSPAATLERVAGWAADALVQGVDTPAVRRLAGLEAGDPDDLTALAGRAAAELGGSLPDGDALLRAYIPVACRAMLRGELSPGDAAAAIHRRVITRLEHPADLMVWCYLAGGLHPVDDHFHTADDAAILAEARRWAAGGDANPPAR